MNNKFFNLPPKKQRRIINAAFKVFSKNEYKKSPMTEISDECGISKALLFHYFTNKKELYLYLCKYAMELTTDSIRKYKVMDADNLFEMMKRNIQAKCFLMKKYPYICAFSLKAYYEENAEVKRDVQLYLEKTQQDAVLNLSKYMDQEEIRQDIHTDTMLMEITLACEGYLFHKYRTDHIDVSQIEKDFSILIAHWEKVYLRRNAK